MCTEGTGISTNGLCRPCSSPTWNDGSYAQCQQCPTTSFSYDGKSDSLGGGAVSPSAATGSDSCLPQFSELTVEQGTLIIDTTTLSNLGHVSSMNACAAMCTNDCQFFTYGYDDDDYENAAGVCFIRQYKPATLTSTKLYFRVNSNQGKDTQSFGWYVRWDAGAEEVVPGPDSAYPDVSTLDDCLRACDFSANCVLAYYKYNSTTNCVLQPGRPVPLYRTAMRGVSTQLVQTQAEDGMPCTFDTECASGYCGGSICRPATCYNGVKDGDELSRDCGNSCLACGKEGLRRAQPPLDRQLCLVACPLTFFGVFMQNSTEQVWDATHVAISFPR